MTTKMTAYVFLCLSALLGPVSLAVFMLFLFFGPPNLIDLGLSEPTALCLNSCLCLAFFIQHSGMIRKPFRRWLEKYMNKAFHNAFYSIISGIILLILIVFWQQSSQTLAAATGNFRWFITPPTGLDSRYKYPHRICLRSQTSIHLSTPPNSNAAKPTASIGRPDKGKAGSVVDCTVAYITGFGAPLMLR